MHDAHQGKVMVLQDVLDLLVRFPDVQDGRQVHVCGELDLPQQQCFLFFFPRIILPMVVQPDFTDGANRSVAKDHLGKRFNALPNTPGTYSCGQRIRIMSFEQFPALGKVIHYGADINAFHPFSIHL